MANPVCSDASLITNAACYRQSVLNPIQQKSMLLLAKLLELDAIGGTSYFTGGDPQTLDLASLMEDTECQPVLPDHIRAALVNIAFLNAVTAGADVPDTLATKMTAIACLQAVPGGLARLEQIDLHVTCGLGVHKDYVQ